MLEKFLRARLPEQIVALIENLEQNPDTSHLEKVDRFLLHYQKDITQFEHWMLMRTMRKVRKLVKRDELLRSAMEIVINKPETYEYDTNTNTYRYKGSGRYDSALNGMTTKDLQVAQQMMNNTWFDPRAIIGNAKTLY
jgi:hypothetical protein